MYIVSKSEEIFFSLFHWGTYVIVRYVVISIALCKTLLNFSFRKKDGWGGSINYWNEKIIPRLLSFN